ncbi:MAG TPA: hypothetical protein PLI90_01910 [Rhodocyclaceae bacterium]|nr:hypothetical protein [Rhodocyclaceae bacterium]
MKRILLVAAMAAFSSATYATDVGVSISVNQPGLYGRVDIGDFSPPQVIYTKPMQIRPTPVDMAPVPLYLHVPPGHARHWRKYCRKYNACGQPVYFVQERWYNNVYVPRHAEHRNSPDERRGGWDHDKGRGHGKDH